jgi:hypothetical protein
VQTRLTIETVRAKIPNNFIMLVECSPLIGEEADYFRGAVDCFINIWDIGGTTEGCTTAGDSLITAIHSSSKSLGEGTMTLYAMLTQPIPLFSNFFKISGRYWLNDHFDYDRDYANGDVVVKYIEGVDARVEVCTALYKLPLPTLVRWVAFLKGSCDDFSKCEAYEYIFFKFLEEGVSAAIRRPPMIGVSGNIAVSGALVEN